jgi:tetratricopeptide (TPR) repeat protein
MTTSDAPDITPDDLQKFMVFQVARISAGIDYPTFVARGLGLAELLLSLPPATAQDEEARWRRGLVLALLRSIWKQTPHPDNRFAPLPLPQMERNGPCHCGSGRKYKACCLPFESGRGPDLDHLNVLPYLLDALPRKRWAELHGSRIGVEMLAATAHDWNRDGRAADVRALLEPWLAADADLVGKREMLFDALLDAYTALHNPRKKAKLLDRALAHGDRTIRSAALQRRVSMLSDQGDYAAAWSLFREAQRHEPDSPSLAHLEVTVLISQGRESEARDRARFWALRLGTRRDPDLQPLIELLREIAADGAAALGEVMLASHPDLGQLQQLLHGAPPVASHYSLSPHEGEAGPLEPTRTLAKALRRWEDVCPPVQHSPMGDELGDLRADLMSQWLPVLQQQPVLWNAFEVLDVLADIIDSHNLPGLSQTLKLPLLDRAERLLDEVLRVNRADGHTLEWGWLQNRPALALLGERARLQFDDAVSDELIARLERLVLTLNPNDNQGFRDELALRYLEAGRADDALSLTARYPNDYAAMRYCGVLALFAADRTGDALIALRDAATAYPKPLAWLLKDNPKPPRASPLGVRVGGDEEAWLYRERALPVWQRLGALDWLRKAKPGLRRKH